MVRWEEDPVYQAIAQAFMSGDLEMHAGGPLDVRAVMTSISQETKDAFAYDHLPWERFPRGPETRGDVANLRSGDADVMRRALRGVSGEPVNNAWSVVALAVPFLLRVAADPRGRVLLGLAVALPVICRAWKFGGDHGASGPMTAPARGVTEPKGDRMSKTDKTRPWWVRMADAPLVTCVPEHDHRFGPCTLPGEITADSASLNKRTSGCHWRASASFLFDCGGISGGREWYLFRREERRRSRHRARRELRAWHSED